MAAPSKEQVIAEGEHALELLGDGAYSAMSAYDELHGLLENVRVGALAISTERPEQRRPDEWGKLADSVLPLQSALQAYKDTGTVPGNHLVEAFSGALEDAEKSPE